jgi:cytochrome c553
MQLSQFRTQGLKLVGVACLLYGVMGSCLAQPVPLAERLVLCGSCHNPDGNSVIPDNPKISNLDPGYLARQLGDFKAGRRQHPVMSAVISGVDESEFKGLAAYFSKQKRIPGTASDAALAARGKEIFEEGITGSAVPACMGCHGENGNGSDAFPYIGGQHPDYVIRQLTNFKSTERNNDPKGVMRAVAKRISEADMRAVAEYVQTLKGDPE